MEMLVYVLLMLKAGEPTGFEVYFQTLTSCSEHRLAILHQSVAKHAFILPKTKRFDMICEPRLINKKDAGSKIIFHDLEMMKDDSNRE